MPPRETPLLVLVWMVIFAVRIGHKCNNNLTPTAARIQYTERAEADAIQALHRLEESGRTFSSVFVQAVQPTALETFQSTLLRNLAEIPLASQLTDLIYPSQD